MVTHFPLTHACVYWMESRLYKDSPHGILKTSSMFHLKCQDLAFSLSLSLYLDYSVLDLEKNPVHWANMIKTFSSKQEWERGTNSQTFNKAKDDYSAIVIEGLHTRVIDKY